jgi:hypothetical protein
LPERIGAPARWSERTHVSRKQAKIVRGRNGLRKVAKMPLQNNTRLDRVVRKKLGRLLRGLYEQLRGEGTLPRFVELFERSGPESGTAGQASPASALTRPGK